MIPSTTTNPYPTAYGALRGGCAARVLELLMRTSDSNLSRAQVVEIRNMLHLMEKEILEIQDAVNLHNENTLSTYSTRF